MPCASARAATASKAARRPVTSWSTRFIDTVTIPPRSGTRNAIARSAGRPPDDARTSRAISFAPTSSVPSR